MARPVSPRRKLMEQRQARNLSPVLVSPTGRDLVLPGVAANAGVASLYRGKLDALIDDMQRSLSFWIKATWRAAPPEIAQDAKSPADVLQAAFEKLRAQWQGKFDEAAPRLALYFTTKATNRAEENLKRILKDAGFSVPFDPTPTLTDVFKATVNANVGLIKSIASEHLTQVEGMVMRSVQAGGDLATLTNELQHEFGVTRRRAKFIANDQNSKATSAISDARRVDLGLTEAIWQHSGGGKHPRPLHVAATGTRYDIRKGCYIGGKYVQAGQEPNCKCRGKVVIPGLS